MPKSARAIDALLEEGGVRVNEKIPDVRSLESLLSLRLRLLADGCASPGVSGYRSLERPNSACATTASRRRPRVAETERVMRPSLRFVPALVVVGCAETAGGSGVTTASHKNKNH